MMGRPRSPPFSFGAAGLKERGMFRFDVPYARPGMRVGLLGGSFDPAHTGHVHITKTALKRFDLDQVWWLVSPGNPLKDRGPAPLLRRLAAARLVMQHPRVRVTDLEAQIGTRFTAETLQEITGLYPGVRFVWLMGADNLASFHHWQRWQDIAMQMPIGVIARPEHRVAARTSPAARRFRPFRLPGRASVTLPEQTAPAWCFVNAPMRGESSTDLRAKGLWPH